MQGFPQLEPRPLHTVPQPPQPVRGRHRASTAFTPGVSVIPSFLAVNVLLLRQPLLPRPSFPFRFGTAHMHSLAAWGRPKLSPQRPTNGRSLVGWAAVASGRGLVALGTSRRRWEAPASTLCRADRYLLLASRLLAAKSTKKMPPRCHREGPPRRLSRLSLPKFPHVRPGPSTFEIGFSNPVWILPLPCSG